MAEEIGQWKVRGPTDPVKKGDLVEIRTLIKHPMESGLRTDPESGEKIPSHYINEMEVTYNGQPILKSSWTGAVSKNPYFAFYLKAEVSGKVIVTWKDNKGGVFTGDTELTVQSQG